MLEKYYGFVVLPVKMDAGTAFALDALCCLSMNAQKIKWKRMEMDFIYLSIYLFIILLAFGTRIGMKPVWKSGNLSSRGRQ